ncbi:hypothetical protein B7494_g4668 [Chlorociboria aeruginascens]|nr:hypothetical protein B7494_g4668 [Chlorociboria aeruginascens]
MATGYSPVKLWLWQKASVGHSGPLNTIGLDARSVLYTERVSGSVPLGSSRAYNVSCFWAAVLKPYIDLTLPSPKSAMPPLGVQVFRVEGETKESTTQGLCSINCPGKA